MQKKVIYVVAEPETLPELEEWGETHIYNEWEKMGFRLAIYKIKTLGLCPPVPKEVE